MVLTEVEQDILTVSPEYSMAHCISKDCAMGVGVAKCITDKYIFLKDYCRGTVSKYDLRVPSVIPYQSYDTRIIFNLITKEKYWHKPYLESLIICLRKLSAQCSCYGVTKLAIPRLGCYHDKLDWEDVRHHVCIELSNLEEVLVCTYDISKYK